MLLELGRLEILGLPTPLASSRAYVMVGALAVPGGEAKLRDWPASQAEEKSTRE